MIPINSRATPRGSRVSVSSVMQYLICGSIDRSPTLSVKLVSVAPRSSRLNSSILPRLRSHPIHRPSRSFHWRMRWNRKKRSPPPSACFALSAVMPARAAARISRSRGSDSVGASGKSVSRAKWTCASKLPRACTSRCAMRSIDALDAVEQRRHDHHRSCRGRDGSELEPSQARRRDHIADDPLQQLHRNFAGRHHREQRDRDQRPAVPTMRYGVDDGHGDQHGGPDGDGSEIDRGCPRKTSRRVRSRQPASTRRSARTAAARGQ